MDESWKESLPEHVRSWSEVQTAKTPEDFYKQIGDHRAHLGRAIVPPGPDAGDEARQQFYEKLQRVAPDLLMPKPNPEDPAAMEAIMKQLGRPEKAEDYAVTLADGSTAPQEKVDALRQHALEAGLTKKQFAILAEKMLGEEISAANARARAVAEEQSALRVEWGADVQRRLDAAAEVAKLSGASEEKVAAIQRGEVSKSEALYLFSVYERDPQFSDNPSVGDPGIKGRQAKMTPTEIRQRISEIRSNKDHPFNVKTHPDHQDWIQRQMPALYEQLDG